MLSHHITTGLVLQPIQVFTTATVANTLLLTIDRYIAVVHPLKYSGCWLTRNRPLCATIIISWLLCITWNLLPPILKSFGAYPDHLPADYVWHSYTLAYGFYGLPLMLILLLNIAVVLTIYKLEPRRRGQLTTSPNERVCSF